MKHRNTDAENIKDDLEDINEHHHQNRILRNEKIGTK